MKKISVITLQNVRNYGSALQALATQEVFERLGYSVDFYNYHRSNISSTRSRVKSWVKNSPFWKKCVLGVILYPSFIKQKIVFERFICKYLHQQKEKVCCIDDLKKIKHDAEIYCTGSDQTWNSSWNGGILPEMFLDFVPENARKISYAASFGKTTLDEDEAKKTRDFLKDYAKISVREISAKKIIEEQLGLPSATHVLDPTLQVDGDFWRSILTEKQKNKKNKGRYVLVYQLNTNAKFDAYAKEFARRKGWSLVRLCTRFDQIVKVGNSVLVPEVTDFVSLIANAGCVITDSFHATAFSCNLNVPVIAVYPDSFSSRIDSLLKLLGLENRRLKNYADFSFVSATEIDFVGVNDILNREREIGWAFLREAVAET